MSAGDNIGKNSLPYVCILSTTWVIFDAPLDDLSDVFECCCILPQVVVAECYTVTCVCPVALYLEHRVKVGTRLTVTLLL